jgi:predicted metal-dependent enzyme (double-stranded beta helix superfamily)
MSIVGLRDFVTAMTRAADTVAPGTLLMEAARPLMAKLISRDDWLPEACALPHPQYYRQYLLHCDPAERFSLVSFVWGPGQKTPIHDHTVWGLIGMLRGAEISTGFSRAPDGRLVAGEEPVRLEPGDIDAVAPTIGDIHQVVNAFGDAVSISIHLYGGNIGAIRRHVFDLEGHEREFISGYSNESVPNLWDRSREAG